MNVGAKCTVDKELPVDGEGQQLRDHAYAARREIYVALVADQTAVNPYMPHAR